MFLVKVRISLWKFVSWILAVGLALSYLYIEQPGSRAIALDTSSIQAFYFWSETTGWLLIGNHLFFTTNAAKSWQEIASDFSEKGVIYDVYFRDPNHGWIVWRQRTATTFYLLQTSDRGKHWQRLSLPYIDGKSVAKITGAWPSPTDGWLVVRYASSNNFMNGILYRTHDAGRSWEKKRIPVAGSLHVLNSHFGWVYSGPDGKSVFLTFDGGDSWQNIAPNLEGEISTVSFAKNGGKYEGRLVERIQKNAYTRIRVYAYNASESYWHQSEDLKIGATNSFSAFARGAQVFLSVPESAMTQVNGEKEGARLSEMVRQPSSGLVKLEMVNAQIGWGKQTISSCVHKSQMYDAYTRSIVCTSVERLVHTVDGGRHWTPILLPLVEAEQVVRRTVSQSTMRVVNASTQVWQGQGFDKCEVATLSQLQQWHTQSPYSVVNLYGGGCRGCANTALSQSYVWQIYQQGWRFVPTWVGPQAISWGGGCGQRISRDISTAYNQGMSEADKAMAFFENLGFREAVIYYDLEGYPSSADRGPIQAFINGWTYRLQSKGWKSGVYGSSCASHLSDFAAISHVPDALWPAATYTSYYDPNATTNVPCVSNTLWSQHQRIRQYTPGHAETWGGITLNIDSDKVDGLVAAPVSSSPMQTVVVNPPILTPAYGGMCGSAWYRFGGYNGQYAYLTLNTNQAPQSTNSAVWRPNLPIGGTYLVEAYIPSHGVIQWNCPTKTISWDTSDARYHVAYANGDQVVSRDQAPISNGWLSLGTFYFAKGTDGYVKLTDLNGEANLSRTVSFSAMRFTLLNGDTSAPTVSIASSTDSVTGQNPIPVSIHFSEPVLGFERQDIVVHNGQVSNFSGSGMDYVASIVPLSEGQVTIGIPENVAHDQAGNGNLASSQLSLTYYIVIPLADFNGDGLDDIAVFRAANSTWYVRGVGRFVYGDEGDIPVPADYNGDGQTEVAVFRPQTHIWHIRGVGRLQYGMQGDVPVSADYNGDGKANIAVFRPNNGTWYIRGIGAFAYGKSGDIPVPADYDGDGRVDIAVFRPANNEWYIREVGHFLYGKEGDVPVPADYNGDGLAEIAVFRPVEGTWYIRGVGSVVYGAPGDIPVPADYNGDGRIDIAVFRPSNGTWYIRGLGSFVYGAGGDIPAAPTP